MSLTKPLSSQISTAEISNTEFVSTAQIDILQSNLSSFASYSNSTFETGSSFTVGILFDEPIKLIPSDNSNSAYATSNVVSISTPINSRDNLLVYLDGLLQHPDTYIVNGTTLQFANVEPIPSGLTVGVRYLQTANLVVDTATANSIVGANGMLAWDYESKQLRVYDGSTIGGLYANAVQSVLGFQGGTTSGYTSGGATTPTSTKANTIDKFPFSSDANATDVGDLTSAKFSLAGQSSTESGYSSGGTQNPPQINTIDKFPFATDTNAVDVGDLTLARFNVTGQSSTESGYTSGGRVTPAPFTDNTIDKFPFSSDSNATDVGDLTPGKYNTAGQSSTESGYNSGGYATPVTNTIDKFSFSADGNATDVGDLTQARYTSAGQSSSVSGYTSGGREGPPTSAFSNTIDKFPFATDANATDVGDISLTLWRLAGQSSTISGYSSGGLGPVVSNTIDKFSFAADANATDVGDLSQARMFAAGQQI